MANKFLTLILCIISVTAYSQVRGKVTSSDGQTIPFVSVTVENTYTGTTANDQGDYELILKKTGKYTLLFRSIGYKTKRVPVTVETFPYTLDVTLEDETYELKELVISNEEDPAYAIMRQAIAHKKENSEKAGKFEADFYSKGIFRVKNVPEKIMGMKVETGEDVLDSTGSGIIYLSETVSHITFEQPDKLKERIVASKISGNDSGFSYNTAEGTFYNFYNNYIEFDINMISPLANNAFGYYRFKFEGSFFDDTNHEINKIKVIPRRDKEPVFEGYIYIVNDSWALYAIDLDIKGYRIRQPILGNLNLQQNFSYNSQNGLWAKNSQSFDFNAGMLGIGFSGKVTHVYNNYVFHKEFDKKTFSKEIVSFDDNANKKDSTYWDSIRPVPLSVEELGDYKKKDSILEIRKSPQYKDSILRELNRFHIYDVVMGYSYRNAPRTTFFNYDGVMQIPKFNTVQGWNLDTKLSFSHNNKKKMRHFSMFSNFNYGFAEDRLRVNGGATLNLGKSGTFYVKGGNSIEQFNAAEPISPLINSLSTLFFKDNYMKLYDLGFARISHNRWIFNGLNMSGTVEYLRRRPLFNNTDYVLIKNDHDYTSNNPLEPDNPVSAPFQKHELMRATIAGNIRFGQKYISRPDGKIPVTDVNYPGIAFMYQKAFSSTVSGYDYDFIAIRTTYNETIGNKGDFGMNLKAGKFFNAENISFIDYKHFNGNQTHVGTEETYLNRFNLLPYYSHSTNDQYFEAHFEHNFKGFIMNKIPLLDALQWNLVIGYHNIATPDYKPYHEFTAGFDNIGIGAFRLLRIDYVRAYQGGFQTDGIVFGLKFLNIFE
ncbi:DUF5686 and carboxypeptidase regulatory-like domain-containing protein [Flavobacterium rhizosphaerae]|uniref:DUF5686 and carboxypeptidase regulatory-like domain-containing protein n=1 Tax=Flavobacterium rhizosphaerae TaxID=3163298 RepID=A0ABW8YUA2_9FLAO